MRKPKPSGNRKADTKAGTHADTRVSREEAVKRIAEAKAEKARLCVEALAAIEAAKAKLGTRERVKRNLETPIEAFERLSNSSFVRPSARRWLERRVASCS